MNMSRRILEMSIGLLKISQGLLLGVRLVLQRRLAVRYLYKPRPDDIFLVTFPKSGTTLLQMMLYQLTTPGEMDFPHITSVSPWYEYLFEHPDPAAVESSPSPRFFKSHLPHEELPRNARLIYVARDVRDVAVSSYHHQRVVMGRNGRMEPFVDAFLADRVGFGSWFKHIESWWPHRDDPNVLFLRYEEVIADLAGTVRKVARFCSIPLAEADLPRIVERCGFEFMKRHNAKFDPRLRGAERGQFIRKGEAGEGRSVFTPEQDRRLAERLEKLARKLGCAETEELVPLLRPRLDSERA
jgi:Sulfotransferase domain